MNKIVRKVLFVSIATSLLSVSSVFADSSTPPTRQGYTPGSGPDRLYPQKAACVTQSPPAVQVKRPLQHRLNQGVN